jgi:AraC-like DNA-binding protein
VAARASPAFHLLTSGSAWLEVEGGQPAARLLAGDLVVLPRGHGHTVRDSPGSPVRWLDSILEDSPPVRARLQHGGGGERSELLCGGFVIDQLAARPVLEALPGTVHLRANDGRAPEWLSGLVRMIAVEMSSQDPGTEAVVSRLSDALLAQALRHTLLAVDREGGTAGDTQVARALRLLRERPDERWTVPRLASTVGLSRSSLAERFRAETGVAPMQWLTRYRLSRAAEYLRTTDAGIREIARLTGYDSEVSISKAFRRQFGSPPGAYRKAAGAEVTSSAATEEPTAPMNC